ncbi:hypothetical protein AK830_g2338 [Neonectria ditissima]|uniref:Calcineurin-like phosphoesterase domain-containing protein n=1 Tax=Neonectria ditissima TaxID=78410 RepID=A0A0P7BFF0_9HYPO|nr:hypothetical protein AK830_g2338 [Neonectria ditissima]
MSKKRLIIIGDVHGHITEFRNLLDKVDFNRTKGDHLILTGDLVNKGPDSAAVVQLAMDLGADAVRGNNEDRVLLAQAILQRSNTASYDNHFGSDSNNGSPIDQEGEKPMPSQTSPIVEESDRETAASLSNAQIAWLSSLPLILRLGNLASATVPPWNAGTILVVHAGLVPLIPLVEQNPWAVMNMRSIIYSNGAQEASEKEQPLKAGSQDVEAGVSVSLVVEEQREKRTGQTTDKEDARSLRDALKRDREVGLPAEGREGVAWSHVWNVYQSLLEMPAEQTVVVYGHDALVGVQVEPEVELGWINEGDKTPIKGTRYAFGLDSGYVYGKQLTALVIEADPKTGGIVHRIEQVESKLAAM